MLEEGMFQRLEGANIFEHKVALKSCSVEILQMYFFEIYIKMHEKVALKKNSHQEQLKHLPTTEKAGKGNRWLKSVSKQKKAAKFI